MLPPPPPLLCSLAVKLLPFRSVLWASLLVLASQSEIRTTDPDQVCQDANPGEQYYFPWQAAVEYDAVTDNYRCLLYPRNLLNCSWSFRSLQNDTQLFVYISVCDSDSTVQCSAVQCSSPFVEKVGWRSWILQDYEELVVTFQVNVTQHGKWTLYSYPYDMSMLEVLSPPPNISVSVTQKDLLVKWDLPYSRITANRACFEYQLDLGDEERPRNLTRQLSYKEENVDPGRTYRVRLRTKITEDCLLDARWSDWSHVVTVEQSVFKLNTLVIVSISLGIPMVLLAVLLLVRHQRVSKVLFPPIPRPPPKYIYFLEKNDTFNVFHPAPSPEPVEEITEVEDTDSIPGKTF